MNLKRTFLRAVSGTLLYFSMTGYGQAGDVLRIPGTEAFHPMLVELADAFNAGHNDLEVVIPEPVGSRGGIKALLAGEAPLASVSRGLKENEATHGLVYRQFAESQVVFVVHPSVTGVTRLTKDQILGIYSGKVDNWKEVGGPDHKIYPITRDGGSTLKALLRYFPAFGDIGEIHAKETYNSEESADLASRYEYTIAYVPLGLIGDTSLNVVEVEGLSPSPEDLNTVGKGVLIEYGLVHWSSPDEKVESFFRFLATPTADAIIARHGCRSTLTVLSRSQYEGTMTQ